MAEFKFFCPQCGRQIKCNTGYSGMQINCPACKQVIVAPQVPSTLSTQLADAASAASQLQAKIEKIQSQAAEKAAEHNVDKTPTASIPKPLPRPTQVQAAAPAPRPAPYRGFVLRDIGPGRALVEGGGRIEEVEPGDILPGGAMVERIERRGQSWVVMTDRGYIGPDFNWDD